MSNSACARHETRTHMGRFRGSLPYPIRRTSRKRNYRLREGLRNFGAAAGSRTQSTSLRDPRSASELQRLSVVPVSVVVRSTKQE